MAFFFDLFPVEILYLIFDFLWAHEILYSFHQIGDYLDSAVLNYQSYAINFESIRKLHFDRVCRHIRPDQVISLILSDKIDTPNQWQLFRSFFSIQQFSHLRALKLIDIDDENGSLLSDLSKVEHLVSLEIIVKTNTSLIESPPSLKRLIIRYSPGILFDLGSMISTIPFYQLHHLTLPSCSYAQLQEIFRQACRLISLNILVMYFNPNEIDTLANFYERLSPPDHLFSLTLSIVVYNRNISRINLEWFLAPLRSLRRLVLIILTDGEDDLLDADQWEMFLVEHLPQLTAFNFKFHCSGIHLNILDRFRNSFWLHEHRRWFVACDSNFSCLFSVPSCAPTSINHPLIPVVTHLTTLPFEQHLIFYDRIIELIFDSGTWTLPYRYNHVKQLTLNSHYINEHVVDLSQVESLIVNNSEWSLCMIVELIKELMPNANYLSLNGTYTGMHYRVFPNVSLQQIRTLDMARHETIPRDDLFKWSHLFPCVERLIVKVDLKRQIPLIIDQFENLSSGTFLISLCGLVSNRQINRECHVTCEWLMKTTFRLGQRNNNNFTYQMTTHDGQTNALHVWIGESNQPDVQMNNDESIVRDTRWWQSCLPCNSVKCTKLFKS